VKKTLRRLVCKTNALSMKHLACFSSLLAALCFGLPATGLSRDSHFDRCDWHGHFYFPGVRVYGPRYYGYGSPYYYGPYYGPSVAYSYSGDSGPAYRGGRVDDGAADDLTVEVQRALRHDGYYRGEIDGDIGAGTRAAIRQFQYDHRLEVTGRIDRALVHSLGIE
jgi:hypothetical protein